MEDYMNQKSREEHENSASAPSVRWYHALIQRIAESEKVSVITKLREYGFEEDTNVFAMLKSIADGQHLPLWTAWAICAERHWGAINRLLQQCGYTPTVREHQAILRRALDLLGYAYLAIGLCDATIHRHEKPADRISGEASKKEYFNEPPIKYPRFPGA